MTACELCKKIIENEKEVLCMNEKEYKMYMRAKADLENLKTRLNGKPIPESIKRDVERRKKIIENFKGMNI